MDFRFDWGEEISKANLNNSNDLNKQSLGDQSSIMPADWTSVMQSLPARRKSFQNNVWQLDSNNRSRVDSPANSPIQNQTSSSPMGLDGGFNKHKLSQAAQDNIMRGLIKLNLVIHKCFKFCIYKLRTAKPIEKGTQKNQKPEKSYGGWSKIDAVTTSVPEQHFESGLFRSDMNMQKISGRGSIFNQVSKNDAVVKMVGVLVRGKKREGFQRLWENWMGKKGLTKMVPTVFHNTMNVQKNGMSNIVANKESGERRQFLPINTPPQAQKIHYQPIDTTPIVQLPQPIQIKTDFGAQNTMKIANIKPIELQHLELTPKIHSMKQFVSEQDNRTSHRIESFKPTQNQTSKNLPAHENMPMQMQYGSRSMGTLPIQRRPVSSDNPYVKPPINSENLMTGFRMNAPYVEKCHTAKYPPPVFHPALQANSPKQMYSQGIRLTLKDFNAPMTSPRLPGPGYMMLPQGFQTQRPVSMNNLNYSPIMANPRPLRIPTTINPQPPQSQPFMRQVSPPRARNVSPPGRPMPSTVTAPMVAPMVAPSKKDFFQQQALNQYGFVQEGARSPRAGISLLSKTKTGPFGRR